MKDRIIELILYKYGEISEQFQNEYKIKDVEKYGNPPVRFLISEFDDYYTKFIIRGKVINTWILDKGILSKCDDSDYEINKEVKGMFYAEGKFFFAISPDLDYVNLCFQVGPRYGFGTRYKIVIVDNNMQLVKDKDLWIS